MPSKGMPHRSSPCNECPWSTTTPPGQFSAQRYADLRYTSGTPGKEAPIGSPLFACHVSQEGHDLPCAGWLAVVGRWSLPVRILIAQKHLPATVLDSEPDWPPLFEDYATMEKTQGVRPKRRTRRK
jgi:hypothetical protein